MEILCIVDQTAGKVSAYDTSYKTFLELKASITLTTKLTMLVKQSTLATIEIVNLSTVLVRTIIGRCDTWATVLSSLTNTIIKSNVTTINVAPVVSSLNEDGTNITTPFPISINYDKVLKIHSCLTNPGIAVDYGSHKLPDIRNISSLRWTLRDLVFKKFNSTSITDKINLINCLPVISGMVHFPIFYNNELFALNGVDALNSTGDRNKELLLLDTTPLGGMEVIRFTDCTLVPVDDSPNRLKFVLPSNKTMKNKSVILVIGGRLYFQSEFHVVNERILVVDPQFLCLDQIALKNNLITGDYYAGTGTVTNTDTIATKQALFTNVDSHNTFIVIVNNKSVKVTKTKPSFYITVNSCRICPGSTGLMITESTRDILDFTTVRYQDYDLLTYTLPLQLFNLTKSYSFELSVGVSSYNSVVEEFDDIGNAPIQLVNLSV